jgi:hypothetical protein
MFWECQFPTKANTSHFRIRFQYSIGIAEIADVLSLTAAVPTRQYLDHLHRGPSYAPLIDPMTVMLINLIGSR